MSNEEKDEDLIAAEQELEDYLMNGSPEMQELWENYKEALASTQVD